jgi:hypothetical protein
MDRPAETHRVVARTFPCLGSHVLVAQAAGLPPVEAEILAHNFHRPHLVKVGHVRAPAGEWIFRSRIAGPALERGDSAAAA